MGPDRQIRSLQLWGVGTSRTIRPIWTAEELGLSYDLVPIGPRTGATQDPGYLEKNPRGKIPYMIDGDFGLAESVAISRYLIEQYGESGGLDRPQSAKDRARTDEWCCFVLAELDETSLYILRRHGELKHIYGEAPVAVESARQYCTQMFEAAAKLLVGPYAVGEHFGLPDIMLMTCLTWAERVNVALPPRIVAYGARIADRPAYRRARTINAQPQR